MIDFLNPLCLQVFAFALLSTVRTKDLKNIFTQSSQSLYFSAYQSGKYRQSEVLNNGVQCTHSPFNDKVKPKDPIPRYNEGSNHASLLSITDQNFEFKGILCGHVCNMHAFSTHVFSIFSGTILFWFCKKHD